MKIPNNKGFAQTVQMHGLSLVVYSCDLVTYCHFGVSLVNCSDSDTFYLMICLDMFLSFFDL